MATSLLTLENPVFARFAFYGAVVAVKTMVMSIMTTRKRFQVNVFANAEDYAPSEKKDVKPDLNNSAVERIRRCHLNDLENVVPFILIGMLYVTTGPDLWWATFHFRIFTVCRVLHTFCYLIPVPQPSRASMFMLGWAATISMAMSVLKNAQY